MKKGVKLTNGKTALVDNTKLRLGRYDTPEEAASVYDQFAIQLYGTGRWLNFDYE